jgi:hypothetical protein
LDGLGSKNGDAGIRNEGGRGDRMGRMNFGR